MKRIKFSIKISHGAPNGTRRQPTVSRAVNCHRQQHRQSSLSHDVGSLLLAGVSAHRINISLAVAYDMMTRLRVLSFPLLLGRWHTFVHVNVIINEWLLSSTPLHSFSPTQLTAFRHLSHCASSSQRALHLIAFANVAINFKSAFTSFRVGVSPHHPLWRRTSAQTTTAAVSSASVSVGRSVKNVESVAAATFCSTLSTVIKLIFSPTPYSA